MKICEVYKANAFKQTVDFRYIYNNKSVQTLFLAILSFAFSLFLSFFLSFASSFFSIFLFCRPFSPPLFYSIVLFCRPFSLFRLLVFISLSISFHNISLYFYLLDPSVTRFYFHFFKFLIFSYLRKFVAF